MATCNRQALILAMKFAWILYCAGAVITITPCEVTVTQPRSLEADVASRNITIPCTFFAEGCPRSSPTVLWFRYLAHTHEDLCMPKCTQSEKFHATSTVPEKRASLRINDVNAGDSAIYFCGVAFADSPDPLSKQTGEGTALTIRESNAYSAGTYVMAAVLLLLFLYLAALFATFKVFSKPKAKEAERGGHVTGEDNRDYKQEMWCAPRECPSPNTPGLKTERKSKWQANVPLQGRGSYWGDCHSITQWEVIKGSGQSISRAIAQELRKKKNKWNRRPRQHLEKETIYQNK